MGLMNWLLKGIGFEDEEDQESEALKLQRKVQKQKLKDAKKKEREAGRLERTNSKLEKLETSSRNESKYNGTEPSVREPYLTNLDQYNISSVAPASGGENFGGYGSSDYTSTNMGGYGSKNVIFFYPKSYSEVHKLIDYIKQGESVMLNLDKIDDLEAQRMLDFASGAAYALNGSIQRVSGNIFLLTPEGLNIMVPKS